MIGASEGSNRPLSTPLHQLRAALCSKETKEGKSERRWPPQEALPSALDATFKMPERAIRTTRTNVPLSAKVDEIGGNRKPERRRTTSATSRNTAAANALATRRRRGNLLSVPPHQLDRAEHPMRARLGNRPWRRTRLQRGSPARVSHRVSLLGCRHVRASKGGLDSIGSLPA